MLDTTFLRQWKLCSSGLWRSIDSPAHAHVSEKHAVSIFSVEALAIKPIIIIIIIRMESSDSCSPYRMMRTGMYQHPVTTVLIVAGHQPFHPFHFGPRPFHLGNPLDPGHRVPDPLVGTLPFKLTGKRCVPWSLYSGAWISFLRHVGRSDKAYVIVLRVDIYVEAIITIYK